MLADRLDALTERLIAAGATPGAAAGLVHDDGTIETRTWGEAIGPDTLLQFGSISKSFTAICLLREAEAGRIDLTRPVAETLPWFPIADVTCHHLLTHTGGIVMGLDENPVSVVDILELPRTAVQPPGSGFWYSNIGYQVLGHVLQAVTGEPFAAAYRKGIFEPLGMATAEPLITNAVRPRMAAGHVALDNERPWEPGAPLVQAPWVEYGQADGSICGTADDLARYARMLGRRGEGVLEPASFELLTQRAVDNGEGGWYGYGLDTWVEAGRERIGHSGGMVGYRAMLEVDVESGAAAVAMVNGHRGSWHLAEHGLRLLLDPSAPEPALDDLADPSASLRPDPEQPAFAGVYRAHNPWMPSMWLGTAGGRPFLAADGERFWMERLDDGSYRVGEQPWSPERLRFDHEVDGRPLRAWYNLAPYVR